MLKGTILLISFIIIIALWNKVFNKLFAGRFTKAYIEDQQGYLVIHESVAVKEKINKIDIYPEELDCEFPKKSDLPSTHKMLLTPEGKVKEGNVVFDKDPNETVVTLKTSVSGDTLVFNKANVHQLENGQLGKLLHQFGEPQEALIHEVNYINSDTILMLSTPMLKSNLQVQLWQVSLHNFKKTLLSDDAYYEHKVAPLVLVPAGFDGVLVAYYSKTKRYGLLSNRNMPKHSTLRIYSEQYEEGADLIEFNYEAGTIIDIAFEKKMLVVTTNPNRQGESDKALRYWHVRFT